MSRLYSPVNAAHLLTTLRNACAAAMAASPAGEPTTPPAGGDLGVVEEALRRRAIPVDIAADLSEIAFGFDNVSARDNDAFEWHKELQGLMGAQSIGDLQFIGCLSGDDNEKPVYYILYHDGDLLRAYVPTDGNSHDPGARRAAAVRLTARRFDGEAVTGDIRRHVRRMAGAPDAPAEARPAGGLHPMFAGMIAPKERRSVTRSEAQKMFDQFYDPTFMGKDQQIDIADRTNAAVAEMLVDMGLMTRDELVAVIDDPELPKTVGADDDVVQHPDAVRLALNEVQCGIADRLSALLNHAVLHGVGLRLVDGRLCAFNTGALGAYEAERSVARHFRVLGEDAEIIPVVADLPAPRHDEAKAEEAPAPVDLMAPLRAIVDEAKAVLTKRHLSVEDLDDHQIIAAALKFNEINGRVREDLRRVDFGLEDIVLSPTSRVPASIDVADILGERGLPEGTSFIGLLGARRGQTPVYFVLWHDGHSTRAYVPEEGNTYDTAFDIALVSGRHTMMMNVDAIVHDLRTYFVSI